jgi:hypothetical protein
MVGHEPVQGLGDLTRLLQFAPEQFAGTLHGRRDAFRCLVLERDMKAPQGTPGGDIAPHGAGADDVHITGPEIPVLTHGLELFLQEKDPYQVFRRRTRDQAGKRCRLLAEHFLRIAGMFYPDIDHGVR